MFVSMVCLHFCFHVVSNMYVVSILSPFYLVKVNILSSCLSRLLSPFCLHFVSISSPFCLHFLSILCPFYLHLVSILAPLKQPLFSSSTAKNTKIDKKKTCVWRGRSLKKSQNHHAILPQTQFWSNTPSLLAMFFPRMHFCCPRPPALPRLVFSPPFGLHLVSIFASILCPFCLLLVPMLSPFSLHFVSTFTVIFNFTS